MTIKPQQYIDAVLDGTLTTGRLQRLAVVRHLYDLEHAAARGFTFDVKKASAACELFPLAMRHTKGEWAGKPFELSLNQSFIVWSLFGWRREDGTRRFRHAYICCARKWGKSEFAAAIGLIAVAIDDPLEPGAEVYCAATKEDQAKIVFSVAQQMARSSPVLQQLVNVHAKSISTKHNSLQPNSFFKPLGSDSKTSDGFNLHVGILDEIHEWRERHRGLYDKLTTAHGSRRQPMIVTITTAGDDLSDIWNEMDALCVSALERFDEEEPPGDNRFAFIARLDEARPCDCGGKVSDCDVCEGEGEIPADDPYDEANWPKANPNYPITPKHEFLKEQAADAKHNPASKHAFLRYHCNLKVSALDKAIAPSVWSHARAELSDWSEADVVCGGWDMGGQDDLAAVGYAARFETGDTDDGKPIYRYEVDAKAFINSENERDLTREPWSSWVGSGLLTVSGNEIIEMRDQIVSDYTDRGCRMWAYDPANSRDFAQTLDVNGLETIKFYQNAGMWTEPLVRFLSDLKKGRITHNGNGLLSWAATNMITVNVSRAASIQMLPDKRSSPEKIDPIVAVIMAYRCAMVAPKRSRGPLFIY